MRLSISILGLALLHCGGGDIPIGANDSGTKDSSPTDSGVTDSGASCDPMAPFGAPVTALDSGAGASTGYLRLSADYLTAYYAATNLGNPGNLYVATRTSIGAPFGTGATLVSGYGQSPTVTGDALTLYFARNNGNPLEVFSTARANATDGFVTAPALLGPPVDDLPNEYYGDYEPFIREDGQELYFTSGRVPSQTSDIYRAQLGSSGFGSVAPVAELNTTSNDGSPTITPNDLVIYFSSQRGTAGDYDIYVATRTSASDPFGTPVRVSELTTTADERPDFITRDGCTLYFDRFGKIDGGVVASSTVYVATKTK